MSGKCSVCGQKLFNLGLCVHGDIESRNMSWDYPVMSMWLGWGEAWQVCTTGIFFLLQVTLLDFLIFILVVQEIWTFKLQNHWPIVFCLYLELDNNWTNILLVISRKDIELNNFSQAFKVFIWFWCGKNDYLKVIRLLWTTYYYCWVSCDVIDF